MFIIENEKIGLRGLELEDAKTLHENMNNSKLTYYLVSTIPYSLQDEEEFIKSTWKDRKEKKSFVFGVIDKKENKLIGTISLMEINNIGRRAELGAWISQDYWNKGYGTELEKLMIKYGFEELNLNSIYAHVYDFNQRSVKAAEKAGFKKQGIMREGYYKHGKYVDIIYLDILKKEWEEKQKEE